MPGCGALESEGLRGSPRFAKLIKQMCLLSQRVVEGFTFHSSKFTNVHGSCLLNFCGVFFAQ